MLILARKTGEAIVINDNVTVRIIEIKGGQVKLGVEAPRQIAIHREEVLIRILEENRRAANETPADLSGLDAFLKASQKITTE
ncbi:MAG: carbon storage regulator CsrA [Desulfobulbaceae bacterium]|nr:carbon storage regulator CsrA [Desulfobulbaceae bacterium]